MSRAPALEREEVPEEIRALYDVVDEIGEALHAAMAAHRSTRQLVELAVTVAAANFSNCINSALNPELRPTIKGEQPWPSDSTTSTWTA